MCHDRPTALLTAALLALPAAALAQSGGVWVCTVEVDSFCVDGAWPEDACISAEPGADWGPFDEESVAQGFSDAAPDRTVDVRLANGCGSPCTLTLGDDDVVLDAAGEHVVEVTADDVGSFSWPFACEGSGEGSGAEAPAGTVELAVTTCTGYATAEGPDCPDYPSGGWASDTPDAGGGGDDGGGGEDDGGADDGGGCSATSATGGGAFGMFGVFVALGMMRRRRGERNGCRARRG